MENKRAITIDVIRRMTVPFAISLAFAYVGMALGWLASNGLFLLAGMLALACLAFVASRLFHGARERAIGAPSKRRRCQSFAAGMLGACFLLGMCIAFISGVDHHSHSVAVWDVRSDDGADGGRDIPLQESGRCRAGGCACLEFCDRCTRRSGSGGVRRS